MRSLPPALYWKSIPVARLFSAESHLLLCGLRAPVRATSVLSGYTLKSHEKIEIRLPGTALRNGTNALAFSMPKPPTVQDPYVYVFELDVEIRFPH